MDNKTSIELARELVEAGFKAQREKNFEGALSLLQQAIECLIFFVNRKL